MNKILNIIIPVYNGAKTIERTLGSLLAQTSRKFIITIVDDGSTDNTVEIVQNYTPRLPIRLIQLEGNHGVAFARQTGLESNECELICFLDSDDMFMPHTVALYTREMRNDFPEMLYTDFLSDVDGKEVILCGRENITWFHGKCYRADFLSKYNIKIPQVLYNEDSGFATVVHELAQKTAYVPEITYLWSSNPDSLTHSDVNFEAKSLSYYVDSLVESFHMISHFLEAQSLPVFYCQLNNIYHYHMELMFNDSEYLLDLEQSIQKLFKDFWDESKIRPNLLLFGFSQFAASGRRGKRFLPTITPVEWLSKMTGIGYIIEDFKLDEDEKESL